MTKELNLGTMRLAVGCSDSKDVVVRPWFCTVAALQDFRPSSHISKYYIRCLLLIDFPLPFSHLTLSSNFRNSTHSNMSSDFTFKRVPASEVTDAMLADTAALFSSAYGVWGPLASQKMGKFAKPGMYLSSDLSFAREVLIGTQATASRCPSSVCASSLSHLAQTAS